MLSIADVCRSRYLLYRNLVDCGFDTGRASLAVDVLLGREEEPPTEFEDEEYEPTPEDWADYREFCEEYEDRMWGLRIEADEPSYLSDRDIMVATGCVG
jgi:hypothetical protein